MARSTSRDDTFRGTLDLLVLQILRYGDLHGWAIAERIETLSDDVLSVGQGALYPALHRLEERSLVESYWSKSENNRRARFYRLTRRGRRSLVDETARWHRFETAVRVVVGQQVSVAGATTTTGGLVERHGTPLAAPALGLTHLFPTPEQLAPLAAGGEGEGMPTRRAATIGALAEAVLDDRVDLFAADPAELRDQLVALPGIGPWTAEVIAMRASRDADVFPAGDLGIRQAIAVLDGATDLPSEDEARDRAAAWSPHRSIAAQHLWASLSLDDPSEERT